MDASKGHVTTKSIAADGTMFVVTGKIMVMSLSGLVTTIIDAGSVDYAVDLATGGGVLAQITVCDADPVGTVYRVRGVATCGLKGLDLGLDGHGFGYSPFPVDGDSIDLDVTGTPSASAIEWTLCWIPLESSASVAAG